MKANTYQLVVPPAWSSTPSATVLVRRKQGMMSDGLPFTIEPRNERMPQSSRHKAQADEL
jgi:hypothetical protein